MICGTLKIRPEIVWSEMGRNQVILLAKYIRQNRMIELRDTTQCMNVAFYAGIAAAFTKHNTILEDFIRDNFELEGEEKERQIVDDASLASMQIERQMQTEDDSDWKDY